MNEYEMNLVKMLKDSGITDKVEIANFLAQAAHESGDFKRMSESFRYSKGPNQVRAVVSSMRKVPDNILLEACNQSMNGNPTPLADLMYNSEYRPNRMGNKDPGDGYKYRGRGIFQITGKDNYKSLGNFMGLDLVNNPDLLLKSPNSENAAITFWKKNVPISARKDVTAARKAINGGTNGLADVQMKYNKYLKLVA